MDPEAPIELVAYDPTWPAEFARERARLTPLLTSWLAGPIEHIGSTAVPGLSAKPVIDIMAPVTTLEASREALPALATLRYQYFPYRADVMHWLCKPSLQHRTHHLHLVPLGSQLWLERLAFRDRLRSDPAIAAAYQTLKTDLAHRYRHDREAYTEAKTPFIRQILDAPREPQSSGRA